MGSSTFGFGGSHHVGRRVRCHAGRGGVRSRARGNCGAWPNKKKKIDLVDATWHEGNGYCQSLITETLGPTVHAYLKQSGELNSVVVNTRVSSERAGTSLSPLSCARPGPE